MNTALSPALHMHSVNHVKFKDGFFAVDEAQRHLKTGESATARRVWTPCMHPQLCKVLSIAEHATHLYIGYTAVLRVGT